MNTRTERHTTRDGFVETGIITHEGREYASGGASVSDTHLVCYPAHPTGVNRDGRLFDGEIRTWSDHTIGGYYITGNARIQHIDRFGIVTVTKLTCYRVRLDDGREYVGRGLGAGMILKCRRAATKGR